MTHFVPLDGGTDVVAVQFTHIVFQRAGQGVSYSIHKCLINFPWPSTLASKTIHYQLGGLSVAPKRSSVGKLWTKLPFVNTHSISLLTKSNFNLASLLRADDYNKSLESVLSLSRKHSLETFPAHHISLQINSPLIWISARW